MPKDDTKILATLRKQFDQDQADEKHLREEAEKDLRFVAGEQWDDALKAERIRNGRPALTFARCHTFVQQVANEARENKPQIKFVPSTDDEDDKADADVLEGMARHIQYDSDAQEAYEGAADYSAGGGFGYFGYLTDYCDPSDPDNWDKDIKVRPIHDPFSVYGVLIPACFGQKPKHAFVIETIPLEQYKKEQPDSIVINFTADDMSKSSGWVTSDWVRVAEYWYIEEEFKTVTRKLPDSDEEETRQVVTSKVCTFKTNGVEIFPGTETTWAVDDEIPIFPVLGKKMIVKGKLYLFGVVRFQRDPQQLINLYKTRIAETLTTSPIQPYMVVEGQIEGHKAEWAQLNSKLMPFLQYRNVDFMGKAAPAPQRQVFEAPIQSLSEAVAQEVDDMKATAGIFDASLGSKGNETSGVAIRNRQQQTNVTNMHFMDNLGRAFSKAGRHLAKLIPIIYDTKRQVRILGEDEKPKIVKINQDYKVGKVTKHHKISADDIEKYDVVVTMGRAFSTKRMESFDMVGQVIQAAPNMLPLIGDIYFRNSDIAGADQLADRFKKMLPPNLQDDENPDGVVIPPAVKANLDAAHQQLQQLTQVNQQMQQELQNRSAEKQMEVQSNEKIKMAEIASRQQIELLKLEVQRDIAEITTKAQDATTRLKLDADLNSKLQVQEHAQTHEMALRAAEVGHEVAMADKGHAQASDMAAQQADHAQQAQATQIQADQQSQDTAQE